MRVEKFKLNRAAFQDQVLYGAEAEALIAGLAGPDAVVEKTDNSRRGGRVRARVYGTAADVNDGSLLRRFGGG